MNDTINIALLGAGFMGKTHAENYKKLDKVTISAVALCTEQEYNTIKQIFPAAKYLQNADDLFNYNSITAYDVCLPTFMHFEYIKKALKAGKPVIAEKPLILDISEGKEILSLLSQLKQHLYVCHVIRFWPEYQYLFKHIKEETFGKLLSLDLYRYTSVPSWSNKNWIIDPKKSGSAMLDLHIHDVDFVLYSLGEPDSVKAIYNEHQTEVFSQYQYKNAIVSIRGGITMPASLPFEMGYQAVFENACIKYSSAATPSLMLYCEDKHEQIEIQKAGGQQTFGDIPGSDGYYNQLKHFVDCIRKEEASPMITPEEAIRSIVYVNKEKEGGIHS